MDLPSASQRVVDAARELGITIQVSQFPDGTKTAAEAAAAVGCPVAAIVKSLVFVVDAERWLRWLQGTCGLIRTSWPRRPGGVGAGERVSTKPGKRLAL